MGLPPMNVQLEFWHLILLLLAFLGCVAGFGKFLFEQVDKRLDAIRIQLIQLVDMRQNIAQVMAVFVNLIVGQCKIREPGHIPDLLFS